MQYVCELPPKTWFRIETEAEAYQESQAMSHAVETYFSRAREQATASSGRSSSGAATPTPIPSTAMPSRRWRATTA